MDDWVAQELKSADLGDGRYLAAIGEDGGGFNRTTGRHCATSL